MGKVSTNENGIFLLLGLAIVFPLIFMENRYVLYVMTLGFIYINCNLWNEYISRLYWAAFLSTCGFFAIGAYAVGILTTKAGLNFWLALVLAIIITSGDWTLQLGCNCAPNKGAFLCDLYINSRLSNLFINR